ncbi:hypothetical protein AB0M12_43585 [Nocardia vinacea]|uniref:hypothetical protein n=1 Tax=Nocardia vinacea TaxID=96468 RepID=UPI003442C15B
MNAVPAVSSRSTMAQARSVASSSASAAALRIREVEATGTGVRVVGGTFDGDVEIGSVQAGRRDQDPPSARR